VGLSGIIFVVLAVAWAGYLIPKALRHHEEVGRNRSVDRFSTAMRVLARRDPVSRRDGRLVVTPARSSERILVPARRTGGTAGSVTAPVTAPAAAPAAAPVAAPVAAPPAAANGATAMSERPAARAAARRRRYILTGLLVVVLAVVALAALQVVPRWGVAVPVALTVLYLVLCRTQVRREAKAGRRREPEAGSSDESVAGPSEDVRVEPRRAVRVEAPYGTPRAARNDQGFEEVSPEEETMSIPCVEPAGVVGDGSAPGEAGSSLWDPVPVTLPTYVTKQQASRTVRTIDLSEPRTWTSGRSEADSKLVEEAASEASAEETGDSRAVGG
jgi:hypothetical protein